MKKPFFVALACVGVFGVMASSISSEAAWKSDQHGRWYTTNTTARGYYIGWKKLNKYTYYFDQDGYAATGWKYLVRDGKKSWFFFDPRGRMMANCWIDGFYLNPDGTMAANTTVQGIPLDQNGYPISSPDGGTSADPAAPSTELKNRWVNEGDEWYYYNYTGKLAKGWLTIKDKTYYMDPETGARVTGLIRVSKKSYYLNPETGVREYGWITMENGKTYYFSPKKTYALTKWQRINKKYYYFNNKGVLAKNKWVGKYYVNETGERVYGWINIGKKRYYTDPSSGIRRTGWKLISGKWYYFKNDGTMVKNKWVGKYYLKSNGVMATKTWVGKYYVNKKGVRTSKTRATGFFTSKGKTYYLNKSYKKVTGWVQENNKYYFFDSKGIMMKNSWVGDFYVGSDGVRYINKFLTVTNADGSKSTYFFPTSGIKAIGLTSYNGKTYFFNTQGVMQTGWQTIVGALYYFNPNGGAMVVNDVIEIDGVYYSFDATGHAQEQSGENSDLSLGKAIADYACKFIGYPYVYGGTSLTNGADCSGFTMRVMEHFGISIPRVAADQATGTSAYATTPYAKPKVVSVSSLQPGDLIFYYTPISHVAIYIGDGLVVHASNSAPYPQGGIKKSAYNYTKIVKCVRYW